MAKSTTRGKTRKSPAGKAQEMIIIDEQEGLIFESEEQLSAYFAPAIKILETNIRRTALRGFTTSSNWL